MRFCAISSGSSGNCTFIETQEHRLLIDVGLSARTIEGMLKEKKIDPATISAIFVTHEHADHIRGVGVWARRYKIPVMATAGTWKGMEKSIGQVPGELRVEIVSGKGYRMGDLRIESIPTCHDANDPCAYTVESGGRKVSVITDTGMTTPVMYKHLCESDIAVIESNHDIDMLMHGPYPAALKRRIRSNLGHLSNQDCGELLCRVREYNPNGTFLLGHLSEENNRPGLALSTVSTMVAEKLGTCGPIDLTARDRSTDIYIV